MIQVVFYYSMPDDIPQSMAVQACNEMKNDLSTKYPGADVFVFQVGPNQSTKLEIIKLPWLYSLLKQLISLVTRK